jgi:predicted 3-demethylubiquinone-9 3-methyltransferase (glyoxalase superfamily)
MQKISPMLWFNDQAEEAVRFYVSIFKNSKIGRIARYGKEGVEIHGREPGSVMTIDFEIAGQQFTALNGGPVFQFNEAISFIVHCETQEEVDYYWERLSAGGDPRSQQCGWIKDKFGVSWQINPTIVQKLLTESDPATAGRVMNAVLQMKKLDIAAIQRAARGES